jgi:triacylglycerol lipase
MDAARDADQPTVVFAHGFLGFGRLPVVNATMFRGVDKLMAGLGAPFLTPQLPRAAGIEKRAAKLARVIERSPARRLVLVGHSMGGLDSRLVAAHMDPDRRVKAVITLGTPHRGSPLADRALAGKGALEAYANWRWSPALTMPSATARTCATCRSPAPAPKPRCRSGRASSCARSPMRRATTTARCR